ncbi:MAG: RNA methyltransferase [Saprospiraceae bacterium]
MRKVKMEELERVGVEAFREQPKTPLVLVLDNVRSAHNVGSAFRTADAFALSEVVLCGITAQPPHREILKTALGATESVRWSYHEEVAEAIAALRSEGYAIWAVEQAIGRCWLQDFQPTDGQPVALIFGNEVEGVSEVAMALSDGAIEIPQFGTKHSLNVAVSMGIVVWDVFRKMRQW